MSFLTQPISKTQKVEQSKDKIFINNDATKITYVCSQIVDSCERFMGILMGKNCLDQGVESKIRHIEKMFGERYSGLRNR